MKRILYSPVLFALLFAPTTLIWAQIDTDRPDQTESSSTVPHGSLQIETGMLWNFEGEKTQAYSDAFLPTNLIRYGISRVFELRMVNEYEILKTPDKKITGISDLQIGTKIQLLKKVNVNTEISFISHLIVPTGSEGLSTEKVGTYNRFCFSNPLSSSMTLGYNLGYNYYGYNDGDLTYTLALAIEVTPKVGIYIEPYGELQNMEEFLMNADAGFTYLINENIQLDYSFSTGITHKSNYNSLGISWRILKE